MNFIRLATVFVALLFSAQVSASPLTYSYTATLESDQDWANLIRVYPGGTAVEGQFQFDETRAVSESPDLTNYNGAFSGYARIGANLIQFTDSLAYTHTNFPGYTIVTMLGGNGWNTGGSISETQAPAGFNVEGIQLRFTFEGNQPANTSLRTLLAEGRLLESSFFVGYGIKDDVIYANWGNITEMRDVPEPATGFLMGLGLIGLLAARKRQGNA
ncbi:PEP-CTERM sorting domain-containing protein [Massilia sp. CF038]|uniref:PEP-CTERM sorting domain-containing protein n=1 Tax=Massilia sp. CF038 TaxID=1881045 RepID=UPI000918E238|nr:PEP-CTERM sorting domain-containing protein [Massilia sp. CF038]SHH72169.1 PEP-CTERM protein-sorting domain-containing protein [Massilia sp. CF038]